MDIWEWLDIPPSTDIAEIKSAYARQAKIYHPEEHPEEFKALQSAYKTALRIAKSQGTATYVTPITVPVEDEKEEDIPVTVTEHSFDFSDVDSYGDREVFFRQFLLIAKNPYLCNNLDVWEYFLNRKEFIGLFTGTSFRMNFVRTVCNHSGWRRKTVLFFERYLNKFHTEENKPDDGKWETELTCFRIRKFPLPGLPAFLTDRYFGKEGSTFHKSLKNQISHEQGRELSFDVKSDVIKYMKLYLFYGESQEEFIERLYIEDWRAGKAGGNMVAALAGIYVAIILFAFLGGGNKDDDRISYVMELYGFDEDSYSDEEKERLLEIYDGNWKYAEEAIDDVLSRYEGWQP